MAAAGRKGGTRIDAAARMAAGVADIVRGLSYQAIADKHGVSRRMVRRWAEHPEVREAISRAKSEALEDLQRAGSLASAKLLELLDSEDERIVQSTATAILDRIGVVKSERVEVEDVTAPRDEAEARAKLIAIAQSLGLALPEAVAAGDAMLEDGDGEGSDGDG